MSKVYHSKARRAAQLASEGMTTRQIALLVGVEPEQIKTMRELGERLLSLPAKDQGATT